MVDSFLFYFSGTVPVLCLGPEDALHFPEMEVTVTYGEKEESEKIESRRIETGRSTQSIALKDSLGQEGLLDFGLL